MARHIAISEGGFSAAELTNAVRELFAEGLAGAIERERSAFDRSVAPSREIVLFGAGGLGRKAVAALRKIGLEPVAFADNNPRLWNTLVDGVTVLAPEVAASKYSRRATFVISVWGALSADRMAQRQEGLRALGCEHVVPFTALFWKYPDLLLPHYAVDLPHKLHKEADQIVAACSLWSDDASRREYLAQVRFRLFGDFDGMPAPVQHTIYFPPDLWHKINEEVFVDCGAYDGDTLSSLLEQPDCRFRSFFGFEPDPDNFAKLTAKVAELSQPDSIVLQEAAVGAKSGTVAFSASANAASCVGHGGLLVNCVALDEALGDSAPTYIKMDIEGSELDALAGAAKIIRRHGPLLAISAYHRQHDLWRIPLLIHSLNCQYRLFLRPYRIEGWDLVCYAVPESRLQPNTVDAC